jgi:hypothetical protein
LKEGALQRWPFDPNDVEYYGKILRDSIAAFKTMMPPEFTELIEHHSRPFYLLLDNVSAFAKTNQSDIPNFDSARHIPEGPKTVGIQEFQKLRLFYG